MVDSWIQVFTHRGNGGSSDVTWCLPMEDVHRNDVSQEKEELNKELLPQKKQPCVVLDRRESREQEIHLHNCLLSVVHTSFSWASQEPGFSGRHFAQTLLHTDATFCKH